MLTQMVKVRDETLAASKAEVERLRNELQAAQRRHSDELDRMVTGLKSQVSRLETSSRQNTALLLQHLTSLPQRVADHHHANANKRNRDEGADSPSKRLRLDGDRADGGVDANDVLRLGDVHVDGVVGANNGLRLDGDRAEDGVGADDGPQLPEFDNGDAAGGLELGGGLVLASDNNAEDNAPVDADLDNIKVLKDDGSLVE